MEMPVAQRTRLVADKLADVFEPKNSEKSLGGCAITIAIVGGQPSYCSFFGPLTSFRNF